MSEPAAPPPGLIEFVRWALRENPKPSSENVLARWRARRRGDVDPALFQTLYDEELQRATEQQTVRDPRHTRIVLVTIAVWVLAAVAVALVIGLPGYASCKSTTGYTCGLSLGLSFFLVGLLQLIIGGIVGAATFRRRAPVSQGVLIAMSAVVVLFTVVCFGAAASA